MRHVGQHLSSQPIDDAQRFVAGAQLRRHAIERASDVGDLIAAFLRCAGRQIAGAEPIGRGLERLQPPARRRENQRGRDNRRRREQERPRNRQEAADITDQRTAQGPRRQDDHPAQRAPDLDRRHHDGRAFEPQLGVSRHPAGAEQRARGLSQMIGKRFLPVGEDASTGHDEIDRLDLPVFALDEGREVDLRVLGERGADVGGDNCPDRIRRSGGKRPAACQDEVEHRALRRQHGDDEHHEADADANVEAAVPTHAGSRRRGHRG